MNPRLSWKLPARMAPVAFAFFMSGMVSAMMSLAITAMNTGLPPDYLARVVRAYLASWPVAFFGVLAVRPLVVRLVAWTVQPPAPR